MSEQSGSAAIAMNGHKSGYDNPAMSDIDEVPSQEPKKIDKEEDGEKKEEVIMVGALEVFRFSSALDIFFMIMGLLCAIVHGSGLPLLIIVFGDMIDSFVDNGALDELLLTVNFAPFNTTMEEAAGDLPKLETIFASLNRTSELQKVSDQFTTDLLDDMQGFAVYYVAIGCGVLVAAWGQVSFWLAASFRQTRRIRTELFRCIMKQEIGWFDTHESGELNTRMAGDVNKIQEGIGDKLGNFFQWFSTCITGFVIGFVYGWKLSLVILAFSPLIAISGGIMTKLLTDFTNNELKAYATAGAVAEEVISSIRTVVAFSGQKKECERYDKCLGPAEQFGVRKGMTQGMGMGLVYFIIFCVYCMAFWYGAKLVRDEPENYSAGVMMIVFFCVLIGAFALGNAAPNLANYATARGAAYAIFKITDQVPSIDSSSDDGLKPGNITGEIEFKNVHFEYPSRTEVKVLQGLDLKVNAGQTVALVGSSGCGKSTTVQLLMRFYDPTSGSVTIDGNDISELNVGWLREHIGLVSQEPVLFATTIAENIRYGFPDITQSQIEQAAKEANAHDFISKLPQKYETLVGERGAQLSGGQKQRIAIARALVKDPKIILLDEATSALDTESESIVQAALDKARRGRTTIVIAHRLSTIKTADVIAGVDKGKVDEQGTHDELMEHGGIYYQLVTNQTKQAQEEYESAETFDGMSIHPVPSTHEDIQRRSSISAALVSQSVLSIARAFSSFIDVTSQGLERVNSGTRSSGRGLKRALSSQVSVKSDKESKEEEEKLPDPPMGRILKMNAPEWPYIAVGCFAALIAGGTQPAFAMLFTEIIGVFSEPDLEKQESEALLYSLLFIAIGVIQFIAMFLQAFMFAKSGEALTCRLRNLVFKGFLRQEISFFDDPKNSTGALTTRLSTDASAVQGATGARFGSVIQSVGSIGTGLVIGFIYSWKLTFLVMAFVPFITAASLLQMKILQGYSREGQSALEGAGKIATEAIENMRTVAALRLESRFLQSYSDFLLKPYQSSLKRAVLNGLSFSVAQCLLFFAYAACFYLGAYLIENDGLNFLDMFRVFTAVVFGAMAAGEANSFAPDYGKAKESAARIFLMLDNEPSIDSFSEAGAKPKNLIGSVSFRNVKFHYPTRPSVKVLQGLNVTVEPGQILALVGSSGCGKSTTVSLLERFYDATEGSVCIDEQNIKDINLQFVRSKIGIVQQEPILFDTSIKENIAYGDNEREVPMAEIIEAAKNANIHSFIEKLPQGYDTNCGEKGTQLSGGQKQRIAIARALIRDPKILLLDEATSALDTESEKVVQEALDRAQQGRTSIVIAHRLSTIQNAHMIAVIDNGQVAEIGKHGELLAQKGLYYKLQQAQLRRQ